MPSFASIAPDKLARLLGKVAPTDFFHAPMGLPIGSHTPAEIAVSIIAQIIMAQRGGDGRPMAAPAAAPEEATSST